MKPRIPILLSLIFILGDCSDQNRDPLKAEIITSDIDRFWVAFDAAEPDFNPDVFQKEYFDNGSIGLKGFIKKKIGDTKSFSKTVSTHRNYYASIKESTQRILLKETEIRSSMVRLKEIYPKAVFPAIYFVIGRLNSGGTTIRDGLTIGAEFYGYTPDTPLEELNEWERSVIRPVDEIPHIVAHELIHFQQKYDGGNLLQACIKEGAADFIAELISGKHINEHVHDFANPREKELWLEFNSRMHEKDYTGWLYTGSENRPNDLGYWMGYQITKSYYENSADKVKAINEILHIRDFDEFLMSSKYTDKFN